ncbi:glucan endo-1 3-beta-glucosidase 11 isoform X2 [Prunus yedoensis var. nudiflora]|uniref:glucan endo-1,3-beta-D-glucosidase n=1 Tax=Prunus yedoensis var. nudiflora TaxID=2094558 RepID=A0A314UIB5_PRUYE|nr:glucan endo-1 3-beta-glucosidase 11 isoform X2 [Prunus yedoensis var. nudiflora]
MKQELRHEISDKIFVLAARNGERLIHTALFLLTFAWHACHVSGAVCLQAEHQKMATSTSFSYCSSLFLSILIISGFVFAEMIKLYDADPKVLKAFANTGVQFIVGLGNEFLTKVQDPAQAQNWVKSNVQAHLPATNITCIFVGNEVLTFNDTSLSNNLLPAMQSVHAALVSLNLDKQVTVTTAHSLSILETSFPPSAGAFRRDLTAASLRSSTSTPKRARRS